MVFYLKINRKEEYTFSNLQKWLDVISGLHEHKVFIVCDDDVLEDAVKNRISYDGRLEYMKSERSDPEVCNIVKGFANERWENAGYAHMTTFYHAKRNGYRYFWNIDADDTFFCLSVERIRELLQVAEKMVIDDNLSLLSLDMWYTKSCVGHWTFGISYTDNSVNWFDVMTDHVKDVKFKESGFPPNMDGYFTYLRGLNDLKIETFYAENLRFLHYSNDFFRRPWASGFYHWSDGRLAFPILRDCFGIDNLGIVNIPNEVLKIDIGISDEESRKAMIENIYKADRTDIQYRIEA